MMRRLPADEWNHNTHYHDRLLATVPVSCRRALDVGCGRGTFARRLAIRATEVEAIDRDPAVLDAARALTQAPNVRFVEANFLTWEPDHGYDFISLIAVLHHLPFEDALSRARGLLNPGGVLAVLGLDRASSPLHLAARSCIAYPVSGCYRLLRRPGTVGAAVCEPRMTLAEIRERTAALLPDATIRGHLLWRYSLVWMRR